MICSTKTNWIVTKKAAGSCIMARTFLGGTGKSQDFFLSPKDPAPIGYTKRTLKIDWA